mmetsp:Transcript_96199/g.223016  ORF Transcript_96199/g.223016 Transcript_96199/m.223016 type:complete len:205 (+) Transcript_96199:467-1081(+)
MGHEWWLCSPLTASRAHDQLAGNGHQRAQSAQELQPGSSDRSLQPSGADRPASSHHREVARRQSGKPKTAERPAGTVAFAPWSQHALHRQQQQVSPSNDLDVEGCRVERERGCPDGSRAGFLAAAHPQCSKGNHAVADREGQGATQRCAGDHVFPASVTAHRNTTAHGASERQFSRVDGGRSSPHGVARDRLRCRSRKARDHHV